MKKQTALIHIISILSILILFHTLIVTGLIPYDQVWAGRLESVEEMRVFETTSIIIVLAMLVTFSIKYRQLQKRIDRKAINYLIWGFAASFFLNTLGNLTAKSMWELVLGTCVTAYATFLCIVIAGKRKSSH